MTINRFALPAVLLALAGPAEAARHVVTLSGTVGANTGATTPVGEGSADERYEFENDFLQSYYGVATTTNTLNPANPGRPTALPPLERVVVESRTPGSGRTRGFHIPVTQTGIAVADGGTGVVSALTNVSSEARDAGAGTLTSEVSRAWVNNAAIGFTLARVGNTVTYTTENGTPGQPADVWSRTAASVAEINALQFRLRSAGANTVTLSDILLVNDNQTLSFGCTASTVCGIGLAGAGAFTATGGDTHITLFDRIVGDFSLAGKWAFALTGGRAGNNAQIKLLSVPDTIDPIGPIPEPQSWALLITGFGMTGAALRRRRAVAAHA